MSGLTSMNDDLDAARRLLVQKWSETHEVWQDVQAERFLRTVLEPLDRQSQSVSQNLSAVSGLVAAAMREVP